METSVLDTIIERIVEVADPERIILFGSGVRGNGPHSDLDLLVVKEGSFDRRKLVGDVCMNLIGVGQAVDVVIVTPEEVKEYGDTHALVISPALTEGREVYQAGRPSTS